MRGLCVAGETSQQTGGAGLPVYKLITSMRRGQERGPPWQFMNAMAAMLSM